jgi:hypothetical protein
VASTPDGQTDLVETPDALRTWLAAEQHRLDIGDGEIDLAAVKAFRASITDAVEAARAGMPPPWPALRAITDACGRRPPTKSSAGMARP